MHTELSTNNSYLPIVQAEELVSCSLCYGQCLHGTLILLCLWYSNYVFVL